MLVDSSGHAAGSTVTGAIRQASAATGTSFNYLLATAQVESGFNPQAGASTSSARGLFQFIEQTWLGTIKQSGAELGYGRYADAITKTSSGHYQVADPAMRRRDPQAAQRSDRERGHGRRLHPGQCGYLATQARPRAERRRALYRPFSRCRRRGAADLARRQQSECQGARTISRTPRTPIPRSSMTGQPATHAASPRCATFSPRATTSRRNDAVRAAQATSAASAAVTPGTLSVCPSHRRASGSRRLCGPNPGRGADPRECCAYGDDSGGARYGRHDRRVRRGHAVAGGAGDEPDFPRTVPGYRSHRAGRGGGQPALDHAECADRTAMARRDSRRAAATCAICSATPARGLNVSATIANIYGERFVKPARLRIAAAMIRCCVNEQ